MKLIFAIVQNEDSRKLMRELVKNDLSVTRIASTGGFLHSGNATLMIGVTDDRLNMALDIIRLNSGTCKNQIIMPSAYPSADFSDFESERIQVTLGGATVFVINVQDYRKF